MLHECDIGAQSGAANCKRVRGGVRVELAIVELAPAKQASYALRMDLESALDKLSDTARAVVWLHDVEGFTHEEIATQMGKTPSFSKSQLARAHQRLRGWLGEEALA